MNNKGRAIIVGKTKDPLKPSVALLVKLGSLVIHYREKEGLAGHQFDKIALDILLKDEEVVEWFAAMTKIGLMPVPRWGKASL